MLSANRRFLHQADRLDPAQRRRRRIRKQCSCECRVDTAAAKSVRFCLSRTRKVGRLVPTNAVQAAFPLFVGERAFTDHLQAHPALGHFLQHADGRLEHVRRR